MDKTTLDTFLRKKGYKLSYTSNEGWRYIVRAPNKQSLPKLGFYEINLDTKFLGGRTAVDRPIEVIGQFDTPEELWAALQLHNATRGE